MNHYPHTTVATVVPQQGRFLMVQEKSGDSLVYNQPAGHVEVGEGLIAAAVRETYEETGWQVRIERLIGIYSHVHKERGIHPGGSCAEELSRIHRPPAHELPIERRGLPQLVWHFLSLIVSPEPESLARGFASCSAA